MNRFNVPSSSQEARILYNHADFQILSSGSFVRCAVSGMAIPIEELKYWNVKLQEPYFDVAASFKRHMEVLEKQG